MALIRNIGDFDALHDARRNRRLQPDCKWDVCKRYLEESKCIDEDYQVHLLFLLNTADSEMHDRCQRGRGDVSDVDEEDSDNEYDLQYEHYFGKLKKSGNSYVIKDNVNDKPIFVKYEGVSTWKDESKPVSGRNKRDIKQIYRLTNQKHGLENDLAAERQKACGLQAQLGKKGSSRSSSRLVNLIKEKNVINLESEPSNKKPDHQNNQLAQNLHNYGMKSGSNVGFSCKNVLPDLAEKDTVERHIFFREVSRPGSVVKEMQTGFGNNYLAKFKVENDVQARSGIKGFTIKSEHVEAAECPTFCERNGDENNQKNRSDDEHSLDVEILDSAEIFKANNVSPFVASKKIHENMGMEDDLEHLHDPSMYSDYRKQVLNVLGKPFDKEEYKTLQKMVGIGNTPDLNEELDEGSEGSCSRKKKSYLDYHQDVKRKLKANRYNRWKRLTILRGFVFWLENVTKKGAFKPWLDRECSAVEPKSQ